MKFLITTIEKNASVEIASIVQLSTININIDSPSKCKHVINVTASIGCIIHLKHMLVIAFCLLVPTLFFYFNSLYREGFK